MTCAEAGPAKARARAIMELPSDAKIARRVLLLDIEILSSTPRRGLRGAGPQADQVRRRRSAGEDIKQEFLSGCDLPALRARQAVQGFSIVGALGK